MIRLLIAIILVVCVIAYGEDIKMFIVDSGIRDMLVVYLNNW